jgi:hypothetical protein
MASGLAAQPIKAPGRIVINPSGNLATGTFPYNGTTIGKVKGCAWKPLGTRVLIENEALGEVTEVLEENNRYTFTCMLRGWDDDAIEVLRPGNHLRDAASQHAMLEVPGDSVPGRSVMDEAVVLLFVPDDYERVPGIVFYRAIPDWQDGAEISLQRSSELLLPLVFDCLRNDDGRIFSKGLIQGIYL